MSSMEYTISFLTILLTVIPHIGSHNPQETFDHGKIGVVDSLVDEREWTPLENSLDAYLDEMPDRSNIDLDKVDSTTKLLLEAEKEAHRQLRQRKQLEQELLEAGVSMRVPPFFAIVQQYKFVTTVQNRGFLMEAVTRYIAKKTGSVPRTDLRGTPLEYMCEPEVKCPDTPYRSADGSCNNLKHPVWGRSNSVVNRLIPHRYPDGISEPVSLNGTLPSERYISNQVFTSDLIVLPSANHLWASWGQLITHDFIVSGTPFGANLTAIECCTPKVVNNPQLLHPECIPIQIPQGDPFYSQFNQHCMQFLRNTPGPNADCRLGPRNQIVIVTQFLDASFLYADGPAYALYRRSMKGGRLRSTYVNGFEIPFHINGTYRFPQLPDSGCFASQQMVDRGTECPEAGDITNTINPHLSMYSIMMLRKHNQIVDQLSRMNPEWDDEILYQEARKIMYSWQQVITFGEYLPILLGDALMKKNDLDIKESGFTVYDQHANPSILDEFGTSIFRLGHVSFPGTFHLHEDEHTLVRKAKLHDVTFRPFNYTDLDLFIIGGYVKEALAVDNAVTLQLSTQLLPRKYSPNGKNFPFGLDLMSLNIGRGREHGVASYIHFRQFCGLEVPKNFDDLKKWMPADVVRKFRTTYKKVEDIEPFPGSMSESPLPGAAVGPTIACILREQFHRTRFGDRFWFEHGGMSHSFNHGQLQNLRKLTIARLICDTSDTIQRIPRHAFRPLSETNPLVKCDDIPKLDLNLWRK